MIINDEILPLLSKCRNGLKFVVFLMVPNQRQCCLVQTICNNVNVLLKLSFVYRVIKMYILFTLHHTHYLLNFSVC